ncbi:MAG: LacI family DNA-binding transcriptional regulator [Planctomycetota bacterium]
MNIGLSKIAELCGVSTTTVSFVFNDKPGVSEATAKRVLETARKVGYVPRNGHAKAFLKNGGGNGVQTLNNNIGVLMAEGVMSTVPLYAKLFEGVHRGLESRSFKMTPLLKPLDADFSSHSYSDIDGLILCSYHEDLAEKLSIPFVSVFRHPDPQERLYGDHIEPANDRIGVLAAKYFVGRGHENLLVINPSLSPHPAFETRVRSFVQQAERKGVQAESLKVPYMDTDARGNLIDGSRVPSIQKFISDFQSRSDRPTGIFVPCDAYLTILQKCFVEKGIQPGIDVEFLGCNNDNSFFQGLATRPATIDIHPEAIAEAAITALLQRLTQPEPDTRVFKIVHVDSTLVKAGPGVKERW